MKLLVATSVYLRPPLKARRPQSLRQAEISTEHLVAASAGPLPAADGVAMQIGRASLRRLLRDGVTPAQVAAEPGFADQSHLNRFFKRGSGVTLARFSRALGR
jgi:AraC-like DNA-binding protein